MSVPTGICPNGCGPLEPYASADIGVGVQDFGPWGCPVCHWVEPEPAALEECQHNEGGIRGGYCTDCGELVDEDAASEAAWERRMEDGECFRGGESAAFMAEQQEKARRLK